MKVVVKKIDALKRELKFEVPKERVSKKLDEVYKDFSRKVKIKGFRPGKAPRHVVEAEHGALAKEETIKKLIPEVYQEGISQENLAPLDLPDIQDVEFKDGVVKFTAQFDIKPEVIVKDYKAISVKRKNSDVTEEEINKTLDYFKKSQGQDKDAPIDDSFAKGLGYPSLEVFKQSLVRQMEMDKDRQNRMDVEKQISDSLLNSTKLTVPQTLVKKQMEHRLSELRNRLKSQGLPDEEIVKKEKEVHEELQQTVERDVKIYLIFDKIAELEGLQVKEGENSPAKVMEFLLKEANWAEKGNPKK